MRILAIADRNPHIDIAAIVLSGQAQAIITLGDLTREDLLTMQSVTEIPKIGVYGNHDSGKYMPDLGIKDMHLATWEYQGLVFGGFQGCVRYKDNPEAIMYTQAEATNLMQGFPKVDVFISHCPPYGINDEPSGISHQGFYALRVYIDSQQPKVWLHGHTYPQEESLVKKHGQTRIEYVYRYRILEI